MNISLRNPDLEEMENTHAQHRANVDKLDNERRAQVFNTPLNDADKEAYEAWQAEATAGGLYEDNNPADYDSVGHFYRSQKAKDEGRAEENPFAFDEQFAKPTNPRYNPKVGEWSEARLREKADEANATIEAAKARAEEQMEQWKRLSPAQRELVKLYADASKLVAQEGETFTQWGLLPQEEREMRYRALANRMAKLFVGNDSYVPSKDFAEWNGWQPMADGQAMVQRMVEVMSSGGQVLESDLAKEYRARLEQADPNDPKAAEAIATQLMHERGYFNWTREGKSTWDKLGSIVKNIPTFMPTVAGSPAAGTLTKQDFQRSSNEVTKGQAADVAEAKQKFNTDLMRSEAILQWMQIAPSLTDNANSIIARAINAGGADRLDTGWTIPRILGAYHHMGGDIQDFFFLNEAEQEKVAGLLGAMRGKREATLANWAQDLGLGIKDRSLEILFALPGMLSKTSRNAMIDRAFGDGTADAWMRAEQRLYNATADIEVDYGFVGNGLKGALEQMPVWATLALGGMSSAAVKSGALLKGGTKLGQLAATHGAQVALTSWYANMARDEFVRQGGSWEAGTVIGVVVGLAQSLIETQQANQLWGSNLTERQAQTAFVRAAKLLVADSTKGKWKRVFSKEGAGVAKDLLATWALETGQETFEEGLQKFAESFGIELGLSADVVKALKKAAKDGVKEMYDTASTMGWSTLLGSGRRASREIGRHYAWNERAAADGAWMQFLKANAVDISVEDVRKAWNEAGSEEARMQVLRDAGLDNDGAGILNRVFEARERQLRRYKDDARHFLGGLALGGNNAVTLDEQTLGVLSDVLGLRNVGIEVSEGKAVLSFDGATTEDGKTARERLEFSTADLQNSIVTDAGRNMAESVYQSLDKSNALPIVDNKHITREAFIQQWTTDEAFRADVGKGLVRQGTHRGGKVILDANRATIFTALHEVFHYLEERAVASGAISREELKEITKDFRDKDGNLDSEAIADYFAGQYNWFEANRKANRTGVGEYDRAHLAILQSRVDEAKTEEERKAAMDALTAASKDAGRRASDLKKEVERDRAEGDRQLTRIRQRDERIAEAQQRAGMAVTRQEKGVLGQIKLAFQGLADAFLGYRYAQPHEAIDDFAKTLFNYPVRALARVAEEARRMGQMRYSITVDAEPQAQREYDEVVKQYFNTDQWLKAPNGKPTNLTERQWVQVRTPSFKAWFGDWENDAENASKVVDENGEPKVVYRGAPYDPLAQEAGKGVIAPERYFTPDEQYAKRYEKGDGVTRAYFANIRNPFDVRNERDAQRMLELRGGHDFHTGISGALDWAEAPDAEEVNDLWEGEYDGLILDEGGDPSENGPIHRGISYVPFNGGAQVKSATDNIGTFNEANPDIRYSIAADTAHRDLYERYKAGDASALEEARQMVREAAAKSMPNTKVVDIDDLPRMMYHETNADNIHVFNLGIGTHAEDDSETPYGIFTKSTDANIGLGNKQMELFVNAKKTLIVADREAVKRAIPELVPYYDEIKAIDAHYSERFDQAETKEFEALEKWQEANPDADMDAVYPIEAIANDRPANIDSEEYLEAFNEGRQIKAEWKQKYAEAAIKCKEVLTEYLRANGYDSMYFRIDEGTLGRKTDSFIVLDPNQVKSADPFTFDDAGNLIHLSKRFDEANDDIRYSIVGADGYLRKAEWAARRMANNKKIGMENGLTEDQADALEALASVRHELHSSIDELVKGGHVAERVANELRRVQEMLSDSGLEDLSLDTTDYDSIEVLREIEDDSLYTDGEEDDAKFDEVYARIYGEYEDLNREIESYLGKIDEQYGTQYRPTGATRYSISGINMGNGYGDGMSRNAEDAYARGLRTAEDIAKETGVSAWAIELMPYAEGHHVGDEYTGPDWVGFYWPDIAEHPIVKFATEVGEKDNSPEMRERLRKAVRLFNGGFAGYKDERNLRNQYESSVQNEGEWKRLYEAFEGKKRELKKSLHAQARELASHIESLHKAKKTLEKGRSYSEFKQDEKWQSIRDEEGRVSAERDALIKQANSNFKHLEEYKALDDYIKSWNSRFDEWAQNKIDRAVHKGEEFIEEIAKETGVGVPQFHTDGETRFSISGIYTGAAADYAQRLADGTIVNGPSLHYVGTGEGAQVYGWGLYGSKSRSVAEWYARKDAKEKGRPHAVQNYRVYKNGKLISKLKEKTLAISLYEQFGTDDAVRDAIDKQDLLPFERQMALQEIGTYTIIPVTDAEKNIREHLYEQTFFTDREEGDESHLLDWDGEVTEEQRKWVMAQLEKEFTFGEGEEWLREILDESKSSEQFYLALQDVLVEKLGIDPNFEAPKAASEFLARADIDGVKYPVNASRSGDGSDGWNYVSFRDDNIRVDHKWVDGEMRYSIATSISDVAAEDPTALDLSGVRYSITTEAEVADKIRAWADTPEAAGLGWTKVTVEEVLEETQKLLNAIHASLSGDINYDEWVKTVPTLRVDWRDGEKKPVVTWSRGNIEYKYDMSADTLCINNEGLETILSSPVMADLMIHMAGFSADDKSLKKEDRGFTSSDYLTLYETLRDLGFVVPCKGCFDAAMRFKMLPSVAQNFVELVNATIDERNKDPKAFDKALADSTVALREGAKEAAAKASAKNKEYNANLRKRKAEAEKRQAEIEAYNAANPNKKPKTLGKAHAQALATPFKDEKVAPKLVASLVKNLPLSAENKELAVKIGVAGDNLKKHITWTQLMSAQGQTKALADWGGIFRAWQKTGAGRPKDKLLPEPWIGEMVSTVSTIIAPAEDKVPSFRQLEVNTGTGLRRNSHSEFRPILAIDEIQFMREAYLKGLFVFKYMKELDDVRLFGKLGVKFNMSAFPAFVEGTVAAGLDANGDYIMSEESVGGREFPYMGEDGKQHYDGMKGLEEAKKYINEDVSLSSVIFSVPHLIKALTDVPTPSDKRGQWGSLIPFHNSGATAAQLLKQGLGQCRATDSRHPFGVEAMEDYHLGVTNFEQVQNDRFGEGWEVVAGKRAGTMVEPGHKIEFANGTHYFNAPLGIHLFSAGIVRSNERLDEYDAKAATAHPAFEPFVVDYNNKVREIGGDYAYKSAADFYIEQLHSIGLMPRFEFEVAEETFLQMCREAKVDPLHPKLGYTPGQAWNPILAESYYSLFCDYGMTDPATGKWSPHRPVGLKDGTFALPDNAVEIIADGVRRYSERKAVEDSRTKEAIVEYCRREVELGKMDVAVASKILKKYDFSDKEMSPLKGAFSPTEKRAARAAKSRVKHAAQTLENARHSIAVNNTLAHPRAAALEVEHTNALLEARTAAILVAAYSEARNEDVSVADVKDILDGLGYSTVSPMAIAKKVNAARKNQDRERGQAFVKMASDAIAEEPLEAYGQAIKDVVQKAVEKDATNKALTRELEMATGVLPVEFTADNGFSVATSLLLIADDESKMTEEEIAARAAKRQQWREKREQLQRLAAEGDAEAIAELEAMEQGEPVSEEIIDEARMAAFAERQRAIREAAKELRKELDERDTARKPKQKRSANATEEPNPAETTEEDEDNDISDEMLAKALRDKGLAFADVRDLLTYIVQDITARYIAENPDATLDALKTKQVYLHELRKTLKAHILTASRELTYGLAREQIREEANKVADRKTFAGVLASAEHALTRLQSLRVKQNRKSIIADMVKIIDEALGKRPISATTAIQKRKLSGDEEMRLAYVRRVLKMGDTAVRRELERVNQVLAANNVSDSDTLKDTDERNVATAIMQRDVLNVYAGAKHMMPAQLEEMFEFLRDELNGAREAFEKEQAKIAAKIKEMKDWLALAIVQGEPDVILDKDIVGKGIDSIMGIFRLRLEALLDRARGPVREKALEAIDEIDHLMAKAADDLTAQEMDNRKAVAELYKQCYGSATAAKERLNEELPEEVRAKLSKYKTPMTRDHALYLYAYISQHDYNANATKYGRLDGDYVKTLLSVLDKRDLAFLKGMQKILHDQFPALQAEYRKMTGSTVFTTPNYFPVRPRLVKDEDATVGVAESRSWAPIISELTPRVRHGYDTEEIRATEIFFDRLNKYARMMAYGNAGYIVNSVLLSGSVTNAIEAAWGKGETANLRKVLLDTFAGVQLPSDPFSNVVNWTTRAAAVGQLAYNLQSAFVQLAAGWIASGHELGIGNVLKNQWQVMFGLRGGEDVQRALRILQSSNWYKARYGGGLDIHAREAMSMSNSSLFLRLYQAGMKPIQVADWWTSMNNAVAIYLKAEKDYLDKGFSPEEAQARAISAAGSHVERTQQSGRTQDQTNLIRRIPLARMFMMFASAPLQLAQYEIRAFQQLARGVPGASNKVVNSMLINHVLVPALVALARAAWKALTQGDDEDETEEEERKRKAEWAISFGVECALGQYNAVPLLGSATSALANRILGGEYFAQQWSLANMSFASRVAKEGSDSVKALVEHFVNDPYAKPSWDEVIKEFNDFLRINPAWRTADNVAEKYSDKQLFEMLGADIDSDKIRKAKAKRTRESKKRER